MFKLMLSLKPHRQTRDYLCGPACLKIIFSYYGIEASEEKLAKLGHASKTLGTSSQNMKKAAERLGFKVQIQDNASIGDIARWLKKRVPVIVDWFTRGTRDYSDSDIAEGHYSVVAGLDNQYIYLQDPELGYIRKMSRENFKKVWFDFRGRYITPHNLAIRRMMVVYKDIKTRKLKSKKTK